MAEFAYTAWVAQGRRRVSGRAQAQDRLQLLESLSELGYVPLSVRELRGRPDWLRRLREERVSGQDLMLFYRQVATLVRAGVPLVNGLEVAARQARPAMTLRLRRVLRDVAGGYPLHEALSRAPDIFSEIDRGLIRAGEVAGTLDAVLERLAADRERAERVKGKVRSALLYPALVVAVSLVVVAVLVTFVIPTFARLFTEAGVPLPWVTRLLLAVATPGPVWYVGGWFTGLTALVTVLWLQTEEGRTRWDAWKLRLPIVGPVIRYAALAAVARNLAAMLRSGVPVLEALDVTSRTVGNRIFRDALLAVRRSVAAGSNLAPALGLCGVVPPMLVQMVEVGERSGALDDLLDRAAAVYDRELEDLTGSLSSLLEPVLILVIGGVVAFVAFSVFLPLLQLLGSVGNMQ